MILLVIIALIVLAEFLKVKVHKNDKENGSCLAYMFYLMLILTIIMSLVALLVSLEFYTDSLMIHIIAAITIIVYVLYTFISAALFAF